MARATSGCLHGKNVVHMTHGADELHFFYDAQNRPAMVVYNGTAYAYVKSLQGDIVAILDENGNTVVSYGYDAWGAPLWCTGELAETLGKVQPFRYRGYVFDEETGLYYLRSRYYNPRWGRFVNEDLFLSRGVYSYCMNSPICMVDTSGKEPTYVSSLSELDECLYQYLLAGGGNISVDEFCENAAGYIGKKYVQMRCSTLIDKSAGQIESSKGMSTLFREQSIAYGTIEELGYENMKRGTVLGQLNTYEGKEYKGGEYDVAKIKRHDVKHGGIFLGIEKKEGVTYVLVLQSTGVPVQGWRANNTQFKRAFCGVQITKFSVEEMQENGWNIWMWDKRIIPTGYIIDDGSPDVIDF